MFHKLIPLLQNFLFSEFSIVFIAQYMIERQKKLLKKVKTANKIRRNINGFHRLKTLSFIFPVSIQ
ncbi:hypothetical protein CN635_01200 [Priestia aryabhattai]|nr:hypothetical protein CN635_01200 [Priestia aryabhattai]PHF71521.1 hypothetical protein COI42_18735 [Priestia aryabhattai]